MYAERRWIARPITHPTSKKPDHVFTIGFIFMPAMTCSPTHFRVQYENFGEQCGDAFS
jgi:hypothetical protein